MRYGFKLTRILTSGEIIPGELMELPGATEGFEAVFKDRIEALFVYPDRRLAESARELEMLTLDCERMSTEEKKAILWGSMRHLGVGKVLAARVFGFDYTNTTPRSIAKIIRAVQLADESRRTNAEIAPMHFVHNAGRAREAWRRQIVKTRIALLDEDKAVIKKEDGAGVIVIF